MAKENKPKYPFPSHFGSHKSMVDQIKTKDLNNESLVVCVDEYGDYTTEITKLDSGLTDPNRILSSRIKISKTEHD